MLKRISLLFPFDGKLPAAACLGVLFLLFFPFGLGPLPTLCSWTADSICPLSAYYPAWTSLAIYAVSALGAAPAAMVFAARIAHPVSVVKPSREVSIGDMIFSETALFTNIMITGAIGSGKTSSAIYPILDQLCRIYSVPDEETTPNDPYRKLGGLVMDVKGDFYEALICMMHWAGRNVLEDLVVITPWSDYEFAEMKDPDTGLKWFVSMRGGPGANSNEFTILLGGHTMPGDKRPIPISYFLDTVGYDIPLHGLNMTRIEWLKSLEFRPNGETGFLGWRRERGGRLVRISRTNRALKEELLLGPDGKPIYADAPKRLKFERIRYVNNGLTFNIAPPSLSHVELANRLVAMSKNASGSRGTGGESGSYFDDATKKHIQWVIYLLRTIRPGSEVTAMDINRHTVSEPDINKSTRALGRIIEELERKKDSVDEPSEKTQLEAKVEIFRDMYNYFTIEWGELDSKTKSNLISTITNVFTQFLSDPRLRTTFCSTTAVKIDEIMQSGKVFTLVAPEYESAARVFGTSLKMEFQAILRRRTAQAEYDKTRFVLFMCDEVQNFVTSGGNDPTSGDESFMALSRQSKVCNVVATQADSSIINVIGDKGAEVYYAQFGSRLWYQNSDEKTNKRAAGILGKVKREKVTTNGQDVTMPGLFAKENSAKGYSENISYEDKERYSPDVFPNLDVHLCVFYNKTRKGKNNKSCKCRLKPHSIGSPAKENQREKSRLLRWYFRAFIENRLNDIGESGLLDCGTIAEKAPLQTATAEPAKGKPEAGKALENPQIKEPMDEPLPDSSSVEILGESAPGRFVENLDDNEAHYDYDVLEVFEAIDRGGIITPQEEKSRDIPDTDETRKAAADNIALLDAISGRFLDTPSQSWTEGPALLSATDNDYGDTQDDFSELDSDDVDYMDYSFLGDSEAEDPDFLLESEDSYPIGPD